MSNKRNLIIPVIIITFFFLPAVYMMYTRTALLMKIYVLHQEDYAFTYTPLIENTCNKRSGNHASYMVGNKNNTIMAYDGCIIGAERNDIVKIYYNKNDIMDNGIVRVLVKNWILAFVWFAALSAFIVWRIISYYSPPPAKYTPSK